MMPPRVEIQKQEKYTVVSTRHQLACRCCAKFLLRLCLYPFLCLILLRDYTNRLEPPPDDKSQLLIIEIMAMMSLMYWSLALKMRNTLNTSQKRSAELPLYTYFLHPIRMLHGKVNKHIEYSLLGARQNKIFCKFSSTIGSCIGGASLTTSKSCYPHDSFIYNLFHRLIYLINTEQVGDCYWEVGRREHQIPRACHKLGIHMLAI